MKLIHIKANGICYSPMPPRVDKPGTYSWYPVCYIKKLSFGRWQVDYYNESHEWATKGTKKVGSEAYPNLRVILYPAGIEEIKFEYKEDENYKQPTNQIRRRLNKILIIFHSILRFNDKK